MMRLTPDEVARAVMARQRRGLWVGLLTALAWGLWLGAAGWTAALLVGHRVKGTPAEPAVGVRVPLADVKPSPDIHTRTLDPREVLILEGQPIGFYTIEQTRPPTVEERARYGLPPAGGADLGWAVRQVEGILAVLLLALLSTVALLGAVRRATLRQIQASLAAIAGQLADLQHARGTMSPTAGA